MAYEPKDGITFGAQDFSLLLIKTEGGHVKSFLQVDPGRYGQSTLVSGLALEKIDPF
jgi:hypothetical protein